MIELTLNQLALDDLEFNINTRLKTLYKPFTLTLDRTVTNFDFALSGTKIEKLIILNPNISLGEYSFLAVPNLTSIYLEGVDNIPNTLLMCDLKEIKINMTKSTFLANVKNAPYFYERFKDVITFSSIKNIDDLLNTLSQNTLSDALESINVNKEEIL